MQQIKWQSLKSVKEKLKKDWDKGKFLKAYARKIDLFPLRISLKGPKSSELADNFLAVKRWIDLLKNELNQLDKKGVRVEWKQLNNRILGKNEIPSVFVVDNFESLIRIIRVEAKFKLFKSLSEKILADFPCFEQWTADNPLKILEYETEWDRILAILRWLKNHPKSGIYLRELSLPNVDTKFIEKHRLILGILLDLILPVDAITQSFRGITGFERRYGFKTKPSLVRFRILDPELYINNLADISIPADDFAQLNLSVNYVFITENEINGLAFPQCKNAIVIFGLGYGLDRIACASWLAKTQVMYWGDIDTHGFAMLSQIRSYFSHVESFLMDKNTVLQFRNFWAPNRQKRQKLCLI